MLSIYIGGGVEPESHYPQWKREYQNIERYTALNDSIAKLAEGTSITYSISFLQRFCKGLCRCTNLLLTRRIILSYMLCEDTNQE